MIDDGFALHGGTSPTVAADCLPPPPPPPPPPPHVNEHSRLLDHEHHGAPAAAKRGCVDEAAAAQRQIGATRMFKFVMLNQILLYLEAGSVPALLGTLRAEFSLTYVQAGWLGGVVFLAIGIASPFAGYAFATLEPRRVLVATLATNALATAAFGLTPTAYPSLLLAARILMGATQVSREIAAWKTLSALSIVSKNCVWRAASTSRVCGASPPVFTLCSARVCHKVARLAVTVCHLITTSPLISEYNN
jgi:sugar phosphate permease